MKLLYVCADPGIPIDGDKGASVHVRQTVKGLAAAGVDVTLLATRPGHRADLPCRILAPGDAEDRRAAASRGRGTLMREVDRLATSSDLARTALGARGALDEVQIVYERYSLWSLTGLALASSLGVPFVLEVNAPLIQEQERYRQLALTDLAASIESALFERATVILCVSSALVERATRLRGTPVGVHLHGNTVDTNLFRPAEAKAGVPGSGDPASGPTIVFLGSLKPWHGVQGLLDSFSIVAERHPSVRLQIIGDGPERESLERLAARPGTRGRVSFTGAVPHERIPAFLALADIAVAPYPQLEEFYFSPLKIGEYMAVGLPVVSSAIGDVRGILRDGESALLVPPGDISALASALERLVRDTSLRRRLGREGRRIAVERLSLEAGTRTLLALMESLVAEKGRVRIA